MEILHKLKIIQQLTGKTQETLARELGVSFVAFNSWINGKSQPRARAIKRIDALFAGLIGTARQEADVLITKKSIITARQRSHQNILKMILNNPDIRDNFLLALTYHTNRIEGSTVTKDETAAIMFDNATFKSRTLTEQLEVKNHQAALWYLFGYISEKRPVNEQLIIRLHEILLNGIHSEAGLYRRHGVRIVGANVPTANYLKVPVLMRRLSSDLLKTGRDLIAQVSRIHAQFEQIHPFADGNGRVGRLLLNAQLLAKNLPPAVIEQKNRRMYMKSLNIAQVEDDYGQLEDFLCDAVLKGFQILERHGG
ncbi:MAG: Fic family protein [Patescibacteria group bacterium]|jgi:Fic family protein